LVYIDVSERKRLVTWATLARKPPLPKFISGDLLARRDLLQSNNSNSSSSNNNNKRRVKVTD
jgi:hypothetical protein